MTSIFDRLARSFLLLGLVSLLVAISGSVWAQRKPIQLYKTFGNVRFEYDTLIISSQQVKQLLLQEPNAYELFRKARTNSSAASTVGALGGAVLAFAIVNSLLNGEFDTNVALAGGALLAVSLPFEYRYRSLASQAIDLYNQKASARLQLGLIWKGTSVGLVLRF
jgi:hypothetical protein